MSQALRRLVIDATAEIDGRPLALEPVYFPTLIGAYARALQGSRVPLVVIAPPALHESLRAQLKREEVFGEVALVEACVPGPADLLLDLREVQHPPVVKRVARRASASLPKPAWVIKSADDIARAATTLERHHMYALARMLVIPVAQWLAYALLPTRISPNTVTAISCAFGVAAAFVALFPGLIPGVAAALCIHVSITLDFTDGYLARLRGTDSRFGYWLDTVMDEVVKFALFLGMTVIVVRDGEPWATVVALVVLLLYHVLICSHWISSTLTSQDPAVSRGRAEPRWRPGVTGMLHRAVDRLGYLDVHLYLIAIAFLLRIEVWVLLLFAVNYLLRFARMLQVRLASGSLA